jgi:hypothetical protein
MKRRKFDEDGMENHQKVTDIQCQTPDEGFIFVFYSAFILFYFISFYLFLFNFMLLCFYVIYFYFYFLFFLFYFNIIFPERRRKTQQDSKYVPDYIASQVFSNKPNHYFMSHTTDTPTKLTFHCKNGYSFMIDSKSTNTISQLKRKIFIQEAIPINAQSLFFGNQFLDDTWTLAQANLNDGSDVLLLLYKWNDRIKEENDERTDIHFAANDDKMES